MFDVNRELEFKPRIADGKTNVLVRWPSDQEWEDRFMARKILLKRMGRGISQTTIDSVPADAKLYEAIKLNGAPPLTPFEANRIVDLMAACDVIYVEIEGDEADVEMLVFSAKVHHRLKIPNAEQALKLNRATHVFNLHYNTQRMRIGIVTGAEIWDQQNGTSKDYAGAIPALHKDAAVRAVIEYIDREMTEGQDENLF